MSEYLVGAGVAITAVVLVLFAYAAGIDTGEANVCRHAVRELTLAREDAAVIVIHGVDRCGALSDTGPR